MLWSRVYMSLLKSHVKYASEGPARGAQGCNVTPCSPGISAESSRGARALRPRGAAALSCSIIQGSGAQTATLSGAAAPGPFLRGSLHYYPVLTQVWDRVREVGRVTEIRGDTLPAGGCVGAGVSCLI